MEAVGRVDKLNHHHFGDQSMKKLLIAAAAASAVLFCSTGVLAQTAKSQAPTLKQQVEDLKEAVLMLQKRVNYLESIVPTSSIPLMPADPKLSPVSTSGAVFLLGIDQPVKNGNGSEFVLTVVNPQSITYTNAHFTIHVFGKDAEGNPDAYKNAYLLTRETQVIQAGSKNQFRFVVPDMPLDNFAVAYMVGIEFGGIATENAE